MQPPWGPFSLFKDRLFLFLSFQTSLTPMNPDLTNEFCGVLRGPSQFRTLDEELHRTPFVVQNLKLIAIRPVQWFVDKPLGT